jgi:transcriptional regulator with XRE-family HTH domain
MPRARSLPRTLAARSLRRLVGAAIRAEREARGWTQTRLAVLCGVASSTLSRWESGSAALSIDDLAALASAFEREAHEFVSERRAA